MRHRTPLRRAVASLSLLLATLALTGASAPEPEAAGPEDPLQHNRKLLEAWRKDPEHAARLRRDLERFWGLPPEERARIRNLDRELHEEGSATQKRLWGVLERYHSWLERLPEADRKRIESARGEERLAVVRELRERQWVQQLPAPVRNHVEGLPREKRSEEIARLREEQRLRRKEAVEKMTPVRQPRRDKPARLSEFPQDVQTFVRDSLMRQLSAEEREQMEKTEGRWPDYPRKVLELARKHKLVRPGVRLPGPPELWQDVRGALPEVPERTLFHFAMTGLSKEEQERLRQSPRDPAVHEEVKKKFFKKNPKELKRLQQLDARGVALGEFE
jgi:hypothetical protein